MHKLKLTSGGERELNRITGKLFEDINEAILSLAVEPKPRGEALLGNCSDTAWRDFYGTCLKYPADSRRNASSMSPNPRKITP